MFIIKIIKNWKLFLFLIVVLILLYFVFVSPVLNTQFPVLSGVTSGASGSGGGIA